jgi:hypothetical protein
MSYNPANQSSSRKLMTNVGQCGQDNTTIQAEGKSSPIMPSRCAEETDWLPQIGEVVTTIPTIGFNVESVTYKNLNFNVWVRSIAL